MTDRQPGSRRKAVTRSVRMSKEEHVLFGEFCDSIGVTPSEALRRMARSAALLGPTFTGEARAEIVALTRQMRAVGNNLNQAVHHMNVGHVIQSEDMRGHLEAVGRAIGELDRLYRSLCVKSFRRAEVVVAGRSK